MLNCSVDFFFTSGKHSKIVLQENVSSCRNTYYTTLVLKEKHTNQTRVLFGD